MPRPRLLDRPRKLTLCLPESLAERIESFLAKDGRVPKGGWQWFFVTRAEEFFAARGLIEREEKGYDTGNNFETESPAAENGAGGGSDIGGAD